MYSILAENDTSKKLDNLISMCTNKTFSKFRLRKYLSHTFFIHNSLQQHTLSPPLFNLALGNVVIDIPKIYEFQLNRTHSILAQYS